MLTQVIQLVGMWGIGWLGKHKADWFDHKTFGPLLNVATGVVSTVLIDNKFDAHSLGTAALEGLRLAAYAELGHAGAKSLTQKPQGGTS